MNLKLSYRDKVIFISVMIILVLVAGFFLLIRPKFNSVELAKQNLEASQQKKAEIDAKIKTLPDIINEIKETAKLISKNQEIFFNEAEPYENENYVRAIIQEADIPIRAMKTEYAIANPISWYFTKPENVLAYENKINTDLYNELPQEVYDAYNGIEKVSGHNDSIIGVTIMTVTTKSPGDMDGVYAIIDRLAADEKTLTVNTVATTVETQSKSKPSAAGAANTSNGRGKADDEEEMEIIITMYSMYPLNVDKVMQETADVTPAAQ